MPFRSNAQRKFLFAKHPAVAEEFAAHTPKGEHLPEHAPRSGPHPIPMPEEKKEENDGGEAKLRKAFSK